MTGFDQERLRALIDERVNQLVRSPDVPWEPLDEPGIRGVSVKVLRFDEATSRAPTILVKLDPGARYPAHTHPGGEEIFVLEGDIRLGKDHLRAGDRLKTAPNNVHSVLSEGGRVALAVVPEALQLIGAAHGASPGSTPGGA